VLLRGRQRITLAYCISLAISRQRYNRPGAIIIIVIDRLSGIAGPEFYASARGQIATMDISAFREHRANDVCANDLSSRKVNHKSRSQGRRSSPSCPDTSDNSPFPQGSLSAITVCPTSGDVYLCNPRYAILVCGIANDPCNDQSRCRFYRLAGRMQFLNQGSISADLFLLPVTIPVSTETSRRGTLA